MDKSWGILEFHTDTEIFIHIFIISLPAYIFYYTL